MLTSIAIDIFSIIPLLFTILLAKRHILHNKNNVYFISASVITILLLLLEIASYIMDRSLNPGFLFPNHLINILGFSLSPVVPYILYLFVSDMRKTDLRQKLFTIPLVLNALICIFSFNLGWIYYYNAINRYMRGDLFFLPTLVSMVYFVLLLMGTFRKKANFDRADRYFLFSIFLLPIAATVFQILYPDVFLIWGSVSITLLMYYVFTLEQQFSFDIQTGVRNRTAFDKKMKQCQNENTTIFVFDINNLKETNDVYGHKSGDDIIREAVNTIETCFINDGITYRIGGDEFCVICQEVSKQVADDLLSNLDALLQKVNQTRSSTIEIAYGYASHNQIDGESIYSAFSRADNAMYVHKAMLKQNHS